MRQVRDMIVWVRIGTGFRQRKNKTKSNKNIYTGHKTKENMMTLNKKKSFYTTLDALKIYNIIRTKPERKLDIK